MKKTILLTIGAISLPLALTTVVSCVDESEKGLTKEQLNAEAAKVTLLYENSENTLLKDAVIEAVTFVGFDVQKFEISSKTGKINEATKSFEVTFTLSEKGKKLTSDQKTLNITKFKTKESTTVKYNNIFIEAFQRNTKDLFKAIKAENDDAKLTKTKELQSNLANGLNEVQKVIVDYQKSALEEISKSFPELSVDELGVTGSALNLLVDSVEKWVVGITKSIVADYINTEKYDNGIAALKTKITEEKLKELSTMLGDKITDLGTLLKPVTTTVFKTLNTNETTKNIKDLDKQTAELVKYFETEAFANVSKKLNEIDFKNVTNGYKVKLEEVKKVLVDDFKSQIKTKLDTLFTDEKEKTAIKEALRAKFDVLMLQVNNAAQALFTGMQKLATTLDLIKK
ncbi:hypothetical protein [Mycoplasma crocodyli]|uniref:Putative lipoprotein n=1 Tax=Mycoplasma crocodyli (strain ATCC 51981 / MP145) TaxID=512564 RepID=D5E5N1_MYCCM|nr:hypothetical protein [Mycoplasma crocodyli]ADE19429.1 putative lipoprotein [Mycoplasma crocodyli MP145]